MKKLLLVVACVSAISGCVYRSTVQAGKDFDHNQISKIVKGETTEGQLASLFGQPVKKEVVSGNEVKWIYEKVESTAAVRMFSAKPKVDTKRKALEVLIKDGKVINYAFTDTTTDNVIQTTSSL
ncbi:hypothetical protein [Budvicia diplopodorum]|uniref:hypothetical protein n=1 Tax=Budvicia diplopodorum TaxID=1119056 RepID=UPI001357FCE7|nr:hypothetical protein [Budvicia diplopodorum]